MIKVIAFDLVGVLIKDKIEEPELFKRLEEKYNDVKIVIATNCSSSIRNIIIENFGEYIDDIFISEEINLIKPDYKYFKYILDKLNIKNEEMLFLDDSIININSASNIGINTIKVNKDTDLFEVIDKWIINNIKLESCRSNNDKI